MFGFTSLPSDDPLGFVARAAEDTLVYRIPGDVRARRDLRGWQLWHGPRGLRSG
jgi:hypothetical protein